MELLYGTLDVIVTDVDTLGKFKVVTVSLAEPEEGALPFAETEERSPFAETEKGSPFAESEQ